MIIVLIMQITYVTIYGEFEEKNPKTYLPRNFLALINSLTYIEHKQAYFSKKIEEHKKRKKKKDKLETEVKVLIFLSQTKSSVPIE